MKKCSVTKICVCDALEALYEVYAEAYARYENAGEVVNFADFCTLYSELDSDVECWAGYELSTGKMIGYMLTIPKEDYVEISVAKFSAKYMNLKVSNALYYHVLTHYLNHEGKRYASSGERSINHITNTQEYKIKTFGYKKAYCKLHIQYRPWVKAVVTVLYPFRNILQKFSKNKLIYQVWCVLRQEEIHRTFK